MSRHLHLAVLLLCLPIGAHAQLSYQNTYFMHGFNDNANRWLVDSPMGRIGQQIDLGANSQATTTNSTSAIDDQARQMHTNFLSSGLHVLVGHSAGGLVARDAYLSNDPSIASGPSIAAIITVASPHQGAPIARAAIDILTGSQYRIIDSYYDVLASKFTGAGGPASVLDNIIGNIILDFVQNLLVNRLKTFIRDQFGLDTPGSQDLRDNSGFIQRMQVADGVPHANVYGVIDKRNAAIKVAAGIRYEDPQPWIDTKNKVKSAVKACSQIFYNFIIKTSIGRKCHQADDALGSFDDRWNDWTHGPDKSSPFDGYIPKDHSQYPGLPIEGPGNYVANLENHGTITRGDRGVNAIVGAMRFVRMRPAISPLSASISGATFAESGTWNSWTGSGANGTGVYTYQWRAFYQDTQSWVTLGTSASQDFGSDGNFTLELTVSSGGSSATTTMDVRVGPPSCAGQIICTE